MAVTLAVLNPQGLLLFSSYAIYHLKFCTGQNQANDCTMA
jgi:hypothetical protein